MSGFGYGGIGSQVQGLQDQVAPPEAGGGPGEPENFNYGQGGSYNTLTQDMSRNVFGPYSFNNGMFNYTPYGNPYAPPQPPPGGPVTPPPGPNVPDRDRFPEPLDFDTWRRQNPGSGYGEGLGGTLGSMFRYMGSQHGRGPFSGNYYQPGGGGGFQMTGGIPGGGRPSWPGYGYGGMPGRHNQSPHVGYGGAYGGGMHGSYGTPYARPWRGPSAGGMYGKPYNFGYGGPMATTQPVAMW